MPPRIEDSVGPKQLAVLGRWVAFALAGLLVACLCAFLFFGPEAQAKAGKSSDSAPPKSKPASSDPSDNGGKPGKSDPAPPKSDPPPSPPPTSDTPPPPTNQTPPPPTSGTPPPTTETSPPLPPPTNETPPPPSPTRETPLVSSGSAPIGQPTVAAFQHAVAKLVQLVDGLLGGGSEAPTPTDALSTPTILQSLATKLLQLANELLNSYYGQIDYLFSGQFHLPPIGDGFTMPYDSGGGKGDAPIPHQAPLVPYGPPLASTFLSGSGSFSSSDASAQLLVGVLASLLILVLSGKFLWSRRDFLKSDSVLQLALERPG